MQKNEITDQELKELGITSELYNDWKKVMQDIWTAFLKKKLKPKLKQNVIHFKGFKVYAEFVNESYIVVRVEKHEKTILTVRYTGDLKITTLCVFLALTSKVK